MVVSGSSQRRREEGGGGIGGKAVVGNSEAGLAMGVRDAAAGSGHDPTLQGTPFSLSLSLSVSLSRYRPLFLLLSLCLSCCLSLPLSLSLFECVTRPSVQEGEGALLGRGLKEVQFIQTSIEVLVTCQGLAQKVEATWVLDGGTTWV